MLKVFSIRLSIEAIQKLIKIAKKKHLGVCTMVQSWIMERIDTECK
jgi:hypothetical protein